MLNFVVTFAWKYNKSFSLVSGPFIHMFTLKWLLKEVLIKPEFSVKINISQRVHIVLFEILLKKKSMTLHSINWSKKRLWPMTRSSLFRSWFTHSLHYFTSSLISIDISSLIYLSVLTLRWPVSDPLDPFSSYLFYTMVEASLYHLFPF